LVLPLAAEKKPPKPDTLAAVPITELPAAPKIDVATKPPEPEPKVESPPEPEEPSIDRVVWRDRLAFRDRSSFPEQQEEFVEPVENVESVKETEEAIEESSNLQREPDETEQTTPQKELISDRSSTPNLETPTPPVPPKQRIKQKIETTSQTEEEKQEAIRQEIEVASENIEENLKDNIESVEGSVSSDTDAILGFLAFAKNYKDYLFDTSDRPKPEKIIVLFQVQDSESFDPTTIYNDFVKSKILNQNHRIEEAKPSLLHEDGKIYQVLVNDKPYYSVEILPVIDSNNGKTWATILAFWNPALP